ncbi:MAG: hypothetical protein ACREA2_19255 [Blastocatellia bacterium]
MTSNQRFLKVAAVCAFLTAITTLAIHLLPNLWSDYRSFEAQIELRRHSIYLTRLWIVIVHCLLVIISMYAVRTLAPIASSALPNLGFLAFVVFAYTELLRTSLVIFAVNRTWRASYASASDPATLDRDRAFIEGFVGINAALFFLFFTAFLLGTICYGLSFYRATGLDKRIGLLFLLWAALSIPTLIDTLAGATFVSTYFEWVGPYFQPLARVLIGIWLWRSTVPRA